MLFRLFCSLEKRLGYQGQWSKWVLGGNACGDSDVWSCFSAERTLLLPATKSRLRGSASIFPPRRTSPILVTERTISLIAGMNLCTPPETGFMPASFCNTHALTTRPSIYNRVVRLESWLGGGTSQPTSSTSGWPRRAWCWIWRIVSSSCGGRLSRREHGHSPYSPHGCAVLLFTDRLLNVEGA